MDLHFPFTIIFKVAIFIFISSSENEEKKMGQYLQEKLVVELRR